MSTEIKPGQTWAHKQRPLDRLRVNLVRLAHVEFKWVDGLMDIRRTEEFLDAFELVEDTPAPLDPPKVKAGDTVTVEVGRSGEEGEPYSVTGKANVTQNGYMWVGPIRIDPGAIDQYPAVITDHEPAPEPEPVWKPGTTGTATLNNRVSDASSLGLRAMRTLRDGVYGFAFANGLSIADDATTYSVSDFVPDAETPTREHLAGALAHRYGGCDNLGDATEAAQQYYLADADAVLALLRGGSL